MWKKDFKIREIDSGCEVRAGCNWLRYTLAKFWCRKFEFGNVAALGLLTL
jgi:hypothetical protein